MANKKEHGDGIIPDAVVLGTDSNHAEIASEC